MNQHSMNSHGGAGHGNTPESMPMGHNGHNNTGMGPNHGHMGMNMSRQMSFHWGYGVTFLLPGTSVDATKKVYYFLGLLVVCLLAFFAQFLMSLERRIKRAMRHQKGVIEYEIRTSSISNTLEKAEPKAASRAMNSSTLSAVKLFLSVLNAFVMLLFMTFNGGVFISVILGQMLGYLAFSFRDELKGPEEVVGKEKADGGLQAQLNERGGGGQRLAGGGGSSLPPIK